MDLGNRWTPTPGFEFAARGTEERLQVREHGAVELRVLGVAQRVVDFGLQEVQGLRERPIPDLFRASGVVLI